MGHRIAGFGVRGPAARGRPAGPVWGSGLGAWDWGIVRRDLLLAGLGGIVGLTAARH